MPPAVRSFADDLRSRDERQLADLFVARPDLARPAPADVTSLAARASTRASVQRALEHLDARRLRLVEALLVVGPDRATVALNAAPEAVEEGVRDLWAEALVWRAGTTWRLARAVGEILTHPARLGPPSAELGVPVGELALGPETGSAERAAVEEQLSEQARAVVDRLRWSSPRASFTTPALRAVRAELVSVGLFVPLDGDDAVIPREVGLALRDGHLYRDPWHAPDLDAPRMPVADVDSAAAGAVLDLLRRIDDVAAMWDREPPRVLRTGGISVRDHRRIAAGLDASTALTAAILDVGAAAGLFAPDGEVDPLWRPTDLYDEWASWEPARRWAALAIAWRDTARAPSLVGENVDGRLVNLLGRDAVWPLGRARRHDVLALLDRLPPGSAPSREDIDAWLHWQRPLRLPADAPTHADIVLREAEWLGVVARGALTSAGRALLGVHAPSGETPDLDTPVAAMAAAMPESVDRVILQGDLTAVAPGPLTEEAAAFMRTAADVESRGSATVFRFSDASLRRLLDQGVSHDEAVARLARFSMTPVPQALEYLLADVARRHGHLRVGSVGSYVRSDDTATLDALVADASVATLQLRRIAPTVVVSPVPAATLLDVLREHRHSPVAETSDGGVVIHTAGAKRAPTPRERVAPVRVTTLDTEAATRLAADVLAGEKAAADAPPPPAQTRVPSTDPTVTLTRLQEAAAEGAPVWMGYVDSAGDIRRVLFRPAQVVGGRVSGAVDGQDRQRSWSIHRITGVVSA